MHWEYAWAFSRGVVTLDEDPPAWTAVVVGPAPALGTVGDLDPPEQAASATATTAAAASQADNERSLRADSLEVMPPVKTAWCCPRVWGFRYAGDMFRLGPSKHACVARRGRTAHGRSHPRWPTPGSDRGRHRR